MFRFNRAVRRQYLLFLIWSIMFCSMVICKTKKMVCSDDLPSAERTVFCLVCSDMFCSLVIYLTKENDVELWPWEDRQYFVQSVLFLIVMCSVPRRSAENEDIIVELRPTRERAVFYSERSVFNDDVFCLWQSAVCMRMFSLRNCRTRLNIVSTRLTSFISGDVYHRQSVHYITVARGWFSRSNQFPATPPPLVFLFLPRIISSHDWV